MVTVLVASEFAATAGVRDKIDSQIAALSERARLDGKMVPV